MKKNLSEIELSAYIDGELDPERMREIALHLAQDEMLREKANGLRLASRVARRALRDPQAEEMYQQVWKNIEGQLEERQTLWQQAQEKIKLILTPPRLAIVTLALIVVVLFRAPLVNTSRNACWVQAVGSDRATVMVFRTQRQHVTVIWAFEDKKSGTEIFREAGNESVS
jgi:anti-sigma factor RsiW